MPSSYGQFPLDSRSLPDTGCGPRWNCLKLRTQHCDHWLIGTQANLDSPGLAEKGIRPTVLGSYNVVNTGSLGQPRSHRTMTIDLVTGTAETLLKME
jgi:hypothetical protein